MGHTPGPYGVQFDGVSGVGWIMAYADTPDEVTLAEVYGEDEDARLSCEDNSNLFAAAPDLLAACKAFEAWTNGPAPDGDPYEGLYEIHKLAEAAIRKAEGGD